MDDETLQDLVAKESKGYPGILRKSAEPSRLLEQGRRHRTRGREENFRFLCRCQLKVGHLSSYEDAHWEQTYWVNDVGLFALAQSQPFFKSLLQVNINGYICTQQSIDCWGSWRYPDIQMMHIEKHILQCLELDFRFCGQAVSKSGSKTRWRCTSRTHIVFTQSAQSQSRPSVPDIHSHFRLVGPPLASHISQVCSSCLWQIGGSAGLP